MLLLSATLAAGTGQGRRLRGLCGLHSCMLASRCMPALHCIALLGHAGEVEYSVWRDAEGRPAKEEAPGATPTRVRRSALAGAGAAAPPALPRVTPCALCVVMQHLWGSTPRAPALYVCAALWLPFALHARTHR